MKVIIRLVIHCLTKLFSKNQEHLDKIILKNKSRLFIDKMLLLQRARLSLRKKKSIKRRINFSKSEVRGVRCAPW